MRIVKEEKPQGEIVEITQEVRIPGTDIILEAGDKIEVFSAVDEAKKKEAEEDPEEDDKEDDEEEMDDKEEKSKKKK
jgi:hypothetical protein